MLLVKVSHDIGCGMAAMSPCYIVTKMFSNRINILAATNIVSVQMDTVIFRIEHLAGSSIMRFPGRKECPRVETHGKVMPPALT